MLLSPGETSWSGSVSWKGHLSKSYALFGSWKSQMHTSLVSTPMEFATAAAKRQPGEGRCLHSSWLHQLSYSRTFFTESPLGSQKVSENRHKRINESHPGVQPFLLWQSTQTQYQHLRILLPKHTAAQCTIANIRNQPRCPSTNDRVKKMGYIYTMDYDSAIKKNQMLFLATSQMQLLHFSEIAKAAEDKYHVSSDVWQIS